MSSLESLRLASMAPAPLEPRRSVEEEEEEVFRKILDERRAAREREHPSYAVIPRLPLRRVSTSASTSSSSPSSSSSSSSSLSAEEEAELRRAKSLTRIMARLRVLDRMSEDLLRDEDLAEIEHQVAAKAEDEELRITYEDFCNIRHRASESLFSPEVFMKFERDASDRISGKALLRYLRGRSNMAQVRIQLSTFDTTGDDVLTEADLEAFMRELIPTIPVLASMNPEFTPFYVYIAVRRFMFFLDLRRTGRIPIRDIAYSRVMHELLALDPRSPGSEDRDEERGGFGANPGDTAPHAKNWFSPTSALRVYSTYLSLDDDKNGMLTPAELKHYGHRSVSAFFVDRVFEEKRTYDGEMDFKGFLDFVLALQSRGSEASIRYLFDVMDQGHKGFLSRDDLRVFLREIVARGAGAGDPSIRVSDLMTELIDVIGPRNAERITLQDFLRSRVGYTVLHVMADVQAFFAYENRETLTPRTKDDDRVVADASPVATLPFGAHLKDGHVPG